MHRQTNTMPRHKALRGFSANEALIGLGLVALIMGVAWIAFSAVHTNLRTAKASQVLDQTVEAVRKKYKLSNQLPTRDLTLDLVRAHVFADDMLDMPASPTKAYTPWQGVNGVKTSTITVTSATDKKTSDAFTVTFNSIPSGACVDMLVRNTGYNRDPGLVSTGTAAAVTVKFPITAAGAALTCGAASSVSNLAFTYRLKAEKTQ